MLSESVHRAFHVVFSNLMPHEQVLRLVEINGSALTEAFKTRVVEVIGGEGYIYENGVLKPSRTNEWVS